MLDPLYSSEGMLVAALLQDPSQWHEVRYIEPDLIGNPENQMVYRAIGWVMKHENTTPDPDRMVAQVRHLLGEYRQTNALARVDSFTGPFPVVGALASMYAKGVQDYWKDARLGDLAGGIAQIVAKDITLEAKISQINEVLTILDEVQVAPGWKPIDGLHTVVDFMDLSDNTHEWVIPGMLERQERFMLVAPEKAGKTVLTRQVALMLASGHHPFEAACDVPPMRTLLVDLENPAGVARRDFRRQVRAMEDLWSNDNENAYVLHRPAGIHLGLPEDRLMLRQAVDHLEIDLLCLSPIYKAYDGLDKSWEEQAFGVQKPLDRLREDFNLAIWMEHHAPWGERGVRELRPIGSSRWGRWLDYQAAMVPWAPPNSTPRPPFNEMTWQSVRRDEQKLSPTRLRRGSAGASWQCDWSSEEGGFWLDYMEAMNEPH